MRRKWNSSCRLYLIRGTCYNSLPNRPSFDSLRILYEECGMREHVILLGICSKYQTMLVLRRVVTTLQHFFPSTLSELDHSYNDCPDRCHTFPAGHPFRCSTLDNGDVRRLVQTARKAELHVLLPAAFLWLSVDEIPEILSEKYADWSRDELSTLLQGMLELDRIGRDDVFDALYSPQRDISDQCSNPAWCHDSRHAIIIDTQYWGYDKVMPFHTLDFEKSEAPQLCSACEDALKKSYLAGRATAWEQLPGVFGLPGWEELRKSASDALAVET